MILCSTQTHLHTRRSPSILSSLVFRFRWYQYIIPISRLNERRFSSLHSPSLIFFHLILQPDDADDEEAMAPCASAATQLFGSGPEPAASQSGAGCKRKRPLAAAAAAAAASGGAASCGCDAEEESAVCPVCAPGACGGVAAVEDDRWVKCDGCATWYHQVPAA